MSKNANQSKQYRIYVKETNNWWDVNKEFYTNYYCDINAYRKRQQEHSRCVCSASKRYLCDMDCLTCPYVKAGDRLSLDNTDTNKAIFKALKDLPVKSISLDNGSEFGSFRKLEEILNAPVYFAKPHAPWQRCDFLPLSDEELQYVVNLLNNRPRKCLGWRTPAQVFFRVLHLIDDLPCKVHRLALHQQAGVHRFGMSRSHH